VIALIDYRAGNLTSVRKAFTAGGAELYTPERASDLARARAIVVPGVGHFGATAVLDHEWREAILALLANGVPLLGICLGLQWLFEGSEEAPELPGLGVLQGHCHLLRPEPSDAPRVESGPQPGAAGGDGDGRSAGNAFDPKMATSPGQAAPLDADAHPARTAARPPRLKIPHVGWNALTIVRASTILEGIEDGAQAYFTHSYVAPITDACAATTTHGQSFASVFESNQVFGAQFHPEKSGDVGLRLLRNFLDVVRRRS
jgi:glutamine amidotransferase